MPAFYFLYTIFTHFLPPVMSSSHPPSTLSLPTEMLGYNQMSVPLQNYSRLLKFPQSGHHPLMGGPNASCSCAIFKKTHLTKQMDYCLRAENALIHFWESQKAFPHVETTENVGSVQKMHQDKQSKSYIHLQRGS